MWDMMVDERRDSQPIIASASTQQSTFSMTLRMDRELYFCWRQRGEENICCGEMAFLVSLACFCVFALLLRYDVSNCLCHTTYYHPSTYQLMSFCFNVLPCLPVVLFISLVHSFSVLLSHPLFLFVSWPVLACLSISILYVECLLLLNR